MLGLDRAKVGWDSGDRFNLRASFNLAKKKSIIRRERDDDDGTRKDNTNHSDDILKDKKNNNQTQVCIIRKDHFNTKNDPRHENDQSRERFKPQKGGKGDTAGFSKTGYPMITRSVFVTCARVMTQKTRRRNQNQGLTL